MGTASLLTAEQSREGDTFVVAFTGSAETESLDYVASALGKLHDAALAASSRSVTVDIRALEFASSSCLKAFVSWLQRVQQLDDARRYKIVFRSDNRHTWQRRSLTALSAFAAGVVEIRPEAG